MYKLDQAEVLVEYYKPKLEEKIIALNGVHYKIVNVVYEEVGNGTWDVHCTCADGNSLLKIDIETVAGDLGLLSPSVVMKQHKV